MNEFAYQVEITWSGGIDGETILNVSGDNISEAFQKVMAYFERMNSMLDEETDVSYPPRFRYDIDKATKINIFLVGIYGG